VLTLLFFLSPVLYPLESVTQPWLRWIVRLSPPTPFTLGWQRALFEGRFPEPMLWLEMAAVSLVAFAVGALVFSRLRETVVEAV
jgi:lipopolysaccharide transport system permease protein